MFHHISGCAKKPVIKRLSNEIMGFTSNKYNHSP
jgi:hypothetical protein